MTRPNITRDFTFITEALADSVDGYALVQLDDIQAELPTNMPIFAGDQVQVDVKDRKPIIIGVVGRGDQMQNSINGLNATAEMLTSDLDEVSSDVDFIAVWLDIPIWSNNNTESNEWREAVEVAKMHYERGDWSITRINLLLNAGKITQEEYIYIVGENPKK